MRQAILDTDILSEIAKGVDDVVLQNASNYLDEQLSFTSIRVYEVLCGLGAKSAARQTALFLELIADHDEIVPTSDDRYSRRDSSRSAPSRNSQRQRRSHHRILRHQARPASGDGQHASLQPHPERWLCFGAPELAAPRTRSSRRLSLSACARCPPEKSRSAAGGAR